MSHKQLVQHVLGRISYSKKFGNHVTNGRPVGWAQDARGFGAVVRYDDGTKAFWGLDARTMQPVNLGVPPKPRRRPKPPVWARLSLPWR